MVLMNPNQPFMPVETFRITTVIEQLAREFAAHSGESRRLVAMLVEIIVWRTVNGQPAEQITAFLDAHISPGVRGDFVTWVVSETTRRLGSVPGGGAR
ncbi:hypothetical protein AVL48_37935 [Amycolatopsis regifaucium]|uniref:Uncharacterized protein n=2 Tax=Amycolatopsis regifaucium TaxID=546365 RepID=A0A154M764_9PSEU|nr:hypothetical protein AVL48_37935 [Amycolatopsis regifaucium]OKA03045.1 hypothetical protein ATP06_0238225 [Amycolatopsis regifaucium]